LPSRNTASIAGEIAQKLEHRRRFVAPVDVVAQKDQPGAATVVEARHVGDDRIEEPREQVGPAVDVAHGVDPRVRRNARRDL